MAKSEELNLRITTESMRKFCREIALGSANTNRKHAAFMALEAFISRHAGSAAHTHAHHVIQEIVEEFSVETRTQLLAENASALASALNGQKIDVIATIFSSVSRNGFNQLTIKAIEGMTSAQSDDTRQWVDDWCTSAKEQAEQASGYPDALDFRTIDIDLLEYTALSEIKRVLAGHIT